LSFCLTAKIQKLALLLVDVYVMGQTLSLKTVTKRVSVWALHGAFFLFLRKGKLNEMSARAFAAFTATLKNYVLK